MRKHTAFRVGRTTRCRDFRTALSVITTITDLIPGQRLFVFNGTSARRAPPAVPPRLPARAPGPLCVPELIFLRAGTQVTPGCLSWPLRASHAAGWPAAGPPSRPCRGDRRSGLVRCGRIARSWPSRRRHAPRGCASLCWPASVPATRSRAVWGRQGDWRSGSAPRSHRGGRWFEPSIAHQLRSWRKGRSEAFPDRPIRPVDGVFPPLGQVSAHCGSRPCRRRPSSTG
jgi:hypothetical protein